MKGNNDAGITVIISTAARESHPFYGNLRLVIAFQVGPCTDGVIPSFQGKYEENIMKFYN